MPRVSILFTSSAEREFRGLSGEIQEGFASAFELLQENPAQRRPGCDARRLSGIANAWRLRVGEYRGIYSVVGEEIVIRENCNKESETLKY